jgi:hypothetical protein
MSDLLKNFKKNGVVKLKNFFTDQEINLISKRAEELASSQIDFLYLINKNKINKSFLSKFKFKSIKDEILESCNGKELKIKTIENFVDFIRPILKKYALNDYLIEELHVVFLENSLIPEDILFDDVFSSVFLNDKVLNIYRELLQSDKLIYHGEGHMGYNQRPNHGWHTDDMQNYRENTSEKTFQIRGAIFYHSDEKNSGGIKFLHGSHFYIRPSKLIKKLIKKIVWKKNFKNSIFNTRILFPKNYFLGRRDFVLWDKRIIHSPWAVKLKKCSWLSLSPSIEKYFFRGSFPRFLAEKNSFPRSLAIMDISRQSKALDPYLKFVSEREDYKVYWKPKSKLLSPDFISKLASKNITFNDCCVKKFF